MQNINTYKVIYLKDFFTTVEEIEITCTDDEIEELTNKYYGKTRVG